TLLELISCFTTAQLPLMTNITCHFSASLYVTLLRWTTAVMWDRGNISDVSDLITTCVQSADCGLTTRTRTFNFHVQVFQTVLFCGFTGTLCSDLSGERSALT